MRRGEFFQTGREAYIKVIPKKGRDPESTTSYRPISLINIDTKMITKIIATRLADIIPSIIHPAQAGFTKGRSAVLNIRKAIAALENVKKTQTKKPR